MGGDTRTGLTNVTTPNIDNRKLGALGAPEAANGRGSSVVFDVSKLSVSYSGNVALKKDRKSTRLNSSHQ